jgi:methionine synthase / methylenetetrahydrofolate reductase(NADPH)
MSQFCLGPAEEGSEEMQLRPSAGAGASRTARHLPSPRVSPDPAGFLERLEGSVLLCDGAMGTMLYSRGVFLNRCFDELNLSSPALVQEIHLDYLKAGADVIETNTFGANRFKLVRHGLETRVVEINRSGVDIARRAVAEGHREAFVAGSVGPLGNPLQSLDPLSATDIQEIYREQIGALLDAGVDILILETMARREEMEAALIVARSLTDRAIVAQMSFNEDGRTVHGEDAGDMAVWMRGLGADVVGANCAVGPKPMLECLEQIARRGDFLLAAQPNAGTPQWFEGRFLYFSSPEYMATYAQRFIRSCGVRLVGGCCGTTPDHIRAMSASVRALSPSRIEIIEPMGLAPEVKVEPVPLGQRSRFAAKIAAGTFATSVEISPPRGTEIDRVIEGARQLRDAGVDAANIPDGPRASARVTPMALGLILNREVGIEVLLHYCCRDRNLLGMQSDLLGAHILGLRNLIIITGDPPKLGDYPNATAVYDVDSIGLAKIVSRLNRGQDMVAKALGPPTSFLIGVGVNPAAPNLDEEIRRFRLKVDAGADCAFTQPVFDAKRLEGFLSRTEDISIPILIGILPLTSHRNAEFYHNEVPGMNIPESVRDRMRLAGSGDQARREGVAIARDALDTARKSPRIRGAYVMPPFGRYELALEVLTGVLPS